MTLLFILDSLGSTELLLILGAALIFFGPRRLPQLGRQLGKSLSEFRRASDDFKRTWEREVNLESLEKGVGVDEVNSILDKATEKIRAAREAVALDVAGVSATAETIAPSVTPVDPLLVQPREPASAREGEATETVALQSPEPEAPPANPGKHEWL